MSRARDIADIGEDVTSLATDAELSSGLASKLDTPGQWETWTPTWTNLTVGNGTVVAHYGKSGRNVLAYISITLGSTSSVSGDVQATLPVTNRQSYEGAAYVADSGVGSYLARWVVSGGKIYFRGLSVSGSLLGQTFFSATSPFTWATGDRIDATFFYEATS